MTRRSFAGLAVGAIAGLAACKAREEESKEGEPDVDAQHKAVGKDPDDETPTETDVEESDDSKEDAMPCTFDMHADTIDTLCMSDIEPYSTIYANGCHTGTLADTDASVSASRMGKMGWAQCYAVWTPDDCPSVSHLEFYRRGAKFFRKQMKKLGDKFVYVKKGTDIRPAIKEGKVAAILTVENSCALEEGIEVLDEFEKDGVLVCGLTWNAENAVAGGVGTELGLTDLGREYVSELERRQMIVDVSHLSDKGFWELEELATRPYIATHSNARDVCAAARNLTDDQFKAIAERGGLVGLNMHTGFVCDDAHQYSFEELMKHVDHWLDLGGEDVIALGSDRDGSDLPAWIRDCSMQQGFYEQSVDYLGEDLTRKLFFDNAADFFERYARA